MFGQLSVLNQKLYSYDLKTYHAVTRKIKDGTVMMICRSLQSRHAYANRGIKANPALNIMQTAIPINGLWATPAFSITGKDKKK